MDDKYKNGDIIYGRYHQKKLGDKQNKKNKNSEKSGVIPVSVDYTGISYTNGDWYFYCNKCGVNKTHTSGLHAGW